MSEQENWKPIEGFPGYEISDKGRIVSIKTGKRVFMKQGVSNKGYPFIRISHLNRKYVLRIHQLVLKTFGPPQPLNTTPDHINRIKNDNRIENLRWATDQEQHENKDFLTGERHPMAKLTEEQVIEIKRRLSEGVHPKEITKDYNVTVSGIYKIKEGRSWKYLNN